MTISEYKCKDLISFFNKSIPVFVTQYHTRTHWCLFNYERSPIEPRTIAHPNHFRLLSSGFIAHGDDMSI